MFAESVLRKVIENKKAEFKKRISIQPFPDIARVLADRKFKSEGKVNWKKEGF